MDISIFYRQGAVLVISTMLNLLGFSALGQEILILDSSTKNPIPYANIFFGSQKLVANIDGKFILDLSVKGDTLTISAIGYEDTRYAFSQINQDTKILYVNPSVELLNTITISGSRWEERTNNQPLKIERIGNRDVALNNPQTSADLLGDMDHVFIQKSQQGGGSPMIRGFAANRVLIAVDGVRMNNAIFRSGNLQNVLSVDPLALESVEVSYGPGAVLYGSDAIGGVMNFFTLTPKFSYNDQILINLNTSIRYSGANDEKTVHSDFSIGNDKLSFLSSISYSDFGDLRMGSNGSDDYLDEFIVFREGQEDKFVSNPQPNIQIPTAYNQISALNKVKYKPNKNDFLTYSIYYSQLSDVPRYDRIILTRNNQPRYGRWDYGPQNWLFQNLKYSTIRNNAFFDQLALIVGHQNYEESRLTRNFNDPIENYRLEKLKIFTVNLDLKKSVEAWDFYYGIEGVFNDVKSTGEARNILTGDNSFLGSRYPDSDWFSFGAYFSVRKKISEKLSINSGARINNFSIQSDFSNSGLPLGLDNGDLNFMTVSGNIGLVHKLSPRHTLKYIVSTGMRAPNVDDIGKVFDSVIGNVVVPNQNLKAELALNSEINYDYAVGDRLALGGGIYYTHLNNAMVRRDYRISGMDSIVYEGVLSKVQAIQNASNAYVFGLQLGINYRISNSWKINGAYNFQKGEEESDDGVISNSRHVAPGFGKIALKYNSFNWFWQAGINIQGEIKYAGLPVSEREKPEIYASDDNGNPFVPSWWILNTKGGYQFNNGIQIIVGIDNVLDKRYRSYSSGISGPGFNFYTSINYSL